MQHMEEQEIPTLIFKFTRLAFLLQFEPSTVILINSSENNISTSPSLCASPCGACSNHGRF